MTPKDDPALKELVTSRLYYKHASITITLHLFLPAGDAILIIAIMQPSGHRIALFTAVPVMQSISVGLSLRSQAYAQL